MENAKPDPRGVKNFPLDNPKAKIVLERGRLYVCEREYYWDSEKQRGCENRLYLGRIVDGVFYTTEEYKRKFKRTGELRVVERPKNRPYKRKAKPAAEAPAAQAPAEIDLSEVSTSRLTTKRIGMTGIFTALSKQIGLWDDVSSTFGSLACRIAHSFAYHWLLTSNNAAYLFKSWSGAFLLPFDQPVSGKESSEFMRSLAETPDWEAKFFGKRLGRMDEDEVYSYDATNIATKAMEIADAQFGKSKKDGYREQIGLSLMLGHKSGLPVMFRVFPGNVADVTTVADLLSRVEVLQNKRVFAAVVDRGYFSLANIRLCIDGGKRVIFAAKIDSTWVKEAVEEAMSRLWESSSRLQGCDDWGRTICRRIKFDDDQERTVWVHVFRNDLKAHVEQGSFFSGLERFEAEWKAAVGSDSAQKQALRNSKMLRYFMEPAGEPGQSQLVRNHDAIDAAIRYMGCFASVSTMECTAQQAIETYRQRDAIEKCFQAGKSDISMDVIRSHSELTMKGRFIISFIALTILCELRRRMKAEFKEEKECGEPKIWPALLTEMTYNEMQNYLSPIQAIYYGATGRYGEVTEKQRMIAKRLGCKGVFDELPDYSAE